ncbi:MAG: EAL domain-containing protein [Deltaproteobacteria bacterium]|nr:EAL domain-containing protein [Deltaproteobacteria bacterium]
MNRPSLSKKALAALAIILLPILATFLYGYRINRDFIMKYIIEDLRTNTNSLERRVYQFLEMEKMRTADFSTDGYIRRAFEEIINGQKSASARLNEYLVKNKLPLDAYVSVIYIISPEGRVVSSTDSLAIGKDLSKSGFFADTADTGVSVAQANFDGRVGIAVSTRIKSPATGEPLGTMTRLILFSDLDKVLSGAADTVRYTPAVYLVDKDGAMITGARFKNNTGPGLKVKTVPVTACLDSGKEFSGLYRDYNGAEVVGSSGCITPLKWTLLVEVPADEAMAPVAKIRRDAVFTASIVAGLIVMLIFAFYKSVILQLKRLSEAAKRISGGDYDITIPVRTDDEIGQLCSSFNTMAADIKARNKTILNGEVRYSTMLQTANDAIVTIDGNEIITWFNSTAEKLFGYGSSEVLGKNVAILMPERYRERHHEALAKVKKTRASSIGGKTREYEALRKDGSEFPISLTMSPAEIDGKLTFLAIIRDITERKKAEEALKASERVLNMAQHIARLGSWEWDIEKNTLVWSDEIYGIFGLKKDAFGATYEAFLNSVHPEDRQPVTDAVNAALHEKKPYSIDHRILLSDGSVRIVHEQGDVAFDPSGRPLRMIGTVQDITERKQADYELKKLSMAIEQSVNIVFITDINGVIEYVNPVFEEVSGYSKEEAIGKTPRVLSSAEVPREKYQELWRTILSGKTWRSVLKNKKKDGGYFWVNAAISPIKDERGKITDFLAVEEDVTDKMASEERIRYLANNDDLTGLTNRSKFIELLDEWMYFAEAGGESGALCFIDMDQFKLLNDSYGHGVGDEFLRRMALLFKTVVDISYRQCFPGSDKKPLLSRLSGDEFAVFLPSTDAKTSLAIMEELRHAVEAFHFSEHETSASVSAGIVLYPEHGANTKELFKRADAAMYRAKDLGRNRCHLFRPEDKDLENMHSRLSWKEKILKALKEDRFEPWFQPILDLEDDTIRHYEVLARMRDEDGAILMPGSFIDIAERFGLVGLIDRTIIAQAMVVQAEMNAQGKDLTFGLNLSGKDLSDENLLSFIHAKIKETGADPARLVFEITETAAISDLNRAVKFIKALKSIGCRFALDDFGVGFTSFTYLKEMQVDYVKIDGSFIKKLHENANDQVFVKAITDVARGLKIKSIAEFVETEESLKLLRKFRVDFAQGYHIGKPGPAFAAKSEHGLKNVQVEKPVIRATGSND